MFTVLNRNVLQYYGVIFYHLLYIWDCVRSYKDYTHTNMHIQNSNSCHKKFNVTMKRQNVYK